MEALTMEDCELDDKLEDLINMIDTITIDKLKHRGYQKYVDKIVNVTRRSLKIDAARLTILIQYIKSYSKPCFQRDLLIDVLHKIVTSEDLVQILMKPFPQASTSNWDSLACVITAIPDLIANCNCSIKYPLLKPEPFYERLSDSLYETLEHLSRSVVAIHHGHKLFLLKIVGRIALSGHKQTIWRHLTLRSIREPRGDIKRFYFDIVRMTLSPRHDYAPFGIYMDNLIMPIFTDLKPSEDNLAIMRTILGDAATSNEHLRYLICDKSLFKTNYNLPKGQQGVLLFNIAAYLSSLVTTISSHIDNDKYVNEEEQQDGEQQTSLLVATLLEVVRNWASGTKLLIRTYQHSKYLAYALAVLLRHAMQHDKQSIVEHAVGIQTMLTRALPMFLNRASPEQRNLATCVSELILPKLHELVVCQRQGYIAKDGETNNKELLKLDFNVDLNDDLLYLQQLFQQNVQVLFRDLIDTAPSPACPDGYDTSLGSRGGTLSPCPMPAVADKDKIMSPRERESDKQLRVETKVLANKNEEAGTTCRMSKRRTAVVVELDGDQEECESEAKVDSDEAGDENDAYDDDDDLRPYRAAAEPTSQDNSDDDEFTLGGEEDAANVPIYLRDCINGLMENNSRLYVRLCLIKAGVLIDDLIEQDAAAYDDQQSKSQSVRQLSSMPLGYGGGGSSSDSTNCRQTPITPHYNHSRVNDTIRDVGVELARALLFLDNQFNIENFNDHRMHCLVSLCYAAPDVVAKYLIDEFNGQSRSMQQQLDVLHVLVASAHQLSRGLRASKSETLKLSEALCVKEAASAKKANRFAPHASMYFYGVVFRLKADFADPGSLVISQPKSIMSAFRQQGDNGASSNTSSQADVFIKRALTHGESHKEGRPTNSESRPRAPETEIDVEKFLESNSLSDDSFFLSRILIAIANIIGCSAQQLVTCKMSEDLVDILSAYRGHPDSGVQRAIVNCLQMIRECTPGTYYKEYIERRLMRLFGPWLAKNEANMRSHVDCPTHRRNHRPVNNQSLLP